MKLHRSTRKSAYSLVFAFVMMTGIMLVASGTIQNTQEKIRFFQDLEANTQARLSAESAAEIGILKLNTVGGIGYEYEVDEIFCPELEGAADGECKTAGNYTIHSTAARNESIVGNDYYTPMPGTGTSPPIEMCSILDEHLDPDHSCNWNKISQGQGVRIPLYGYDDTGGTLNPSELALDNFKLRVRTPCENGSFGQYCETDDVLASNDRYILDAGPDLGGGLYDIETDDSAILWQLIGQSADEEEDSVTLLPNTAFSSFFSDTIRETLSNSEITESMINTAYDIENYIAFQAGGSGTPFDKLFNMAKSLFTFHDNEWETLYLEFTLGTQLIDQSGDTIPYLEWQLVTNAAAGPFADTKAVLVGEGTYQAQSGTTYYYPYVITRELTGEVNSIYTLSN
jgi:hypothetical protein